MALQIPFLVAFCTIFGIIVFYFLKENYRLRENHREVVNRLIRSSERNLNQIYVRDENLKRYSFLKYNLGDALIVQKNIQL